MPFFLWEPYNGVNPIVAKAGGLQSQDGKCEAVALYCERLPTKDLESSGFPELLGVAEGEDQRGKKMA